MPTRRCLQILQSYQLLFLLLPSLLSTPTSAAESMLDTNMATNNDRLLHLLDRTSRLIDAFAADPERINADGFFGLQLTRNLLAASEVHTAAADLRGNPGMKHVSALAVWQLDSILARLDLLVQRVGRRLAAAEGSYDAVTFEQICEPIIERFGVLTSLGGGGRTAWWKMEIADDGGQSWPEGDKEIVGVTSQLLSYAEPRGDACLVEALRPCRDGSCPSQGRCAYFQRPLKQASGYYLTHQLLYRMINELNPCHKTLSGGPPTLSTEATQMCRKIFTEFKFIETANWTRIARTVGENPITGLRDLYMEQALLCGLTGAGDFFRVASLETVAAWQDPMIGCFKLYGTRESSGQGGERRILRDLEMRGGCSSHSSGMAAGFYSNAIRFLLGV